MSKQAFLISLFCRDVKYSKTQYKIVLSNKKYTIHELMNDPSFCRVAKCIATIPEIKKWSKWIQDSEENREKANVAKAEIIGFEFADPSFPDKKHKWSKLYAETVGSKPRVNIRRSNEIKLKWIFRAVVIFLLISIVGIEFFQTDQNSEELTLFDEMSEEKKTSLR